MTHPPPKLALPSRAFHKIRHSYLNATTGSIRVARLAGIKHAASATVSSTSDTPMNVHGSVALKP
jgi:hypothetical protein